MVRTHRLALLAILLIAGVAMRAAEAQTVSLIYSFSGSVNTEIGFLPNTLTVGNDGNLYGTTTEGGTTGAGTFFKVTLAGAVVILHNFGDGSVPKDGTEPEGKLIVGTDGNFYGTTFQGGSATEGTVYKITPTGTVTILHSFGDGSVRNDGADPRAALVIGQDGNFYGVTEAGGSGSHGTVFRITPTGTETVIHNFGDFTVVEDGTAPRYELILGQDGNFYGVTTGGGAGYGVVFKITPLGTVTILHSFSPSNDGIGPEGALVQGGDGNFYGTTVSGMDAFGMAYRITPSGTETIIHDFYDGTVPYDGVGPQGALILASDGNFYGTTSQGGSSSQGTIYKMTPSGTVTILHSFGDGTVPNDGTDPTNALTIGSDGNFYGVTPFGGTGNVGSIFRLSLSLTPVWYSKNVAAASDGTARILWTRSDRAAGVWTINGANFDANIGPVYGPYSDSHGAWNAKAVKVAGNGTARLLWTRSDGAAGLWSLNQADQLTTVGTVYFQTGSYPGVWTATDLAVAQDGTARLLWTSSDGTANVWTLDATDTETKIGPTYGPYTGWTAKAVSTAADGTTRILWTRSDGAAGLWTLGANDALQTVGTTYGPYSDSQGSWSAQEIGTSADGRSQVLWTRSDGAVGLWTFSAGDAQMVVGPTYGPYAGFTAAAMDAANDKARVLWVRSDRAAGLWSFGTNDLENLIGPVYGPY